MTNEQEPQSLELLEARKQKLSRIIHQRESLFEAIGTGKVREEQSPENAIKTGRVKDLIEASKLRAADRLSQVEEIIQSRRQEENQRLLALAEDHINLVSLRREQVKEIRDFVARGRLKPETLERYETQLRELQTKPATDPELARAFRLRREQQDREKAPAVVEPQKAQPKEEDKESQKKVKLIVELAEKGASHRVTNTLNPGLSVQLHGIQWEVLNYLAKKIDKQVSTYEVKKVAQEAGSGSKTAARDTIKHLKRSLRLIEAEGAIVISGERSATTYRLNADLEFVGHLEEVSQVETKEELKKQKLSPEALAEIRTAEENYRMVEQAVAKGDLSHSFLEEARVQLEEARRKHELKEETEKLPALEVKATGKEDTSGIRNQPDMSLFIDSLPQSTRVLITNFLDSKPAGKILASMQKFDPRSNEESSDFKQALAGAIFEQLGYQYLAGKNANRADLIVISPSEVLELYSSIYPTRSVTNNRFGLNNGLDGITVPDGLILRERLYSLTVDAILDYKPWTKGIPNQQSFERQLANYGHDNFSSDFARPSTSDKLFHARILNELRPEIPVKPVYINPNFKITFVMPENANLAIHDSVSVDRLPVDSRDIGQFIDVLLDTVNKGSSKGDS